MDIGMIVTFAGIVVAALAGVLGVWMERDRTAPPRWAWVFSGFIVIAMCIEMSHSLVQAREDSATDAAMVRVLEQLTELAAKGDNPALEQFVGAELAMQARANPEMIAKLEEKIEEKGGDPNELRQRAVAGRRAAAGLPARAGAAGAGRGAMMRGKAGKAGRAGGGVGAAGFGGGGKLGKAGGGGGVGAAGLGGGGGDGAGAGAGAGLGGARLGGGAGAAAAGSDSEGGSTNATTRSAPTGSTTRSTGGSTGGGGSRTGKAGKAR